MLAAALLSAAAFQVWLAWYFLDGVALWRWVAAFSTLVIAAAIADRHSGALTAWVLTSTTFLVAGWVTLLLGPQEASRPTQPEGWEPFMAWLGWFTCWPLLAFAASGFATCLVVLFGPDRQTVKTNTS